MTGLASFVGGFVDGVDTRHKWKDRKRRQVFEDEDRAWQGEVREWDREDRKYTLEERARLRAEQDRLAAEAQAERDAYAAAFDAANTPDAAGDAAGGGRRSLLDMGTEGVSLPPGSDKANLSFGLPPLQMDPITGAPITQRRQIVEPRTKDDKIEPTTAPDQVTGTRTKDDAIRNVEIPGYTYDDWRRMTPDQRQAANLPSSEIGGQLHFDRFSEGLGIPYKPGRRTVTVDDSQPDTPDTRIARAQMLRDEEDALAAEAIRRDTEARAAEHAQKTAGKVAGATEAPAAAVGPGKPAAETAPAQPPRRNVDPTQTPGATNPAEAPSVQIAAAAAPGAAGPGKPASASALSFGADIKAKANTRRTTLSEASRAEKRATDSFMDNYLEKGVPELMKHFLKTGQIDKARAFDAWVKEADTQKSIKLWSKGVFAAATGNETGMLDAFTSYYNTMDDGLSVIRQESGFITDPETGQKKIKLTFRDDASGETFTQELDSTDDLLQQGIYAMAPERMFEILYGQMEKAQEIEANGLKGDQAIVVAALRAAGAKDTPDNGKRVEAAMKELSSAIPGFSALPQDEQVALLLERLQVEDRAAGAIGEGRYADDLPIY